MLNQRGADINENTSQLDKHSRQICGSRTEFNSVFPELSLSALIISNMCMMTSALAPVAFNFAQ